MEDNQVPYNTADALLDALQEWGVSYLFSNLGSDHPAIIEGLAKAKAAGRALPEVIICPHESVAMSAAHGYALLSGKAQGVFVHTDVGTQNLGGTVHNAARSRVPVFIFSGETPYTMEGELRGTRNTHINHLQNVYDQRGIVRPYVKWEYDIRTGKNVKRLVYRAMQLAHSDPQGPIYLTGAREVLEEEVRPCIDSPEKWAPIEKTPLPSSAVEKMMAALGNARHPLVITSYLGRNAKAVQQLVALCDTLAIPVIEQNASHMNFPWDHPMHQGFQGREWVEKADVILVIDSDAPWVQTLFKPKEDCQIYYIDIDPLKQDLPLWYMPSTCFYQADSCEALDQLIDAIHSVPLDEEVISERYERLARAHADQREQWKLREKQPEDGVITAEWLTACLREVIDEDTIVMDETITNALAVTQHLPRTKPMTHFVNGGSSLGWAGGAAFGAKLAQPDKTVVSLTGDGCYLFGVPGSLYWMSRRYQVPFLTVIYNNQGWNATKQNLLKLYPDGAAKRDDRYWVNFDQPADLAKMAEAAGGAYARTVVDPQDLKEVLQSGMEAVKSGRSAVIDVRIAKISNQKD
ncbi:thiamine pyrophosphate-requiring protein [Brevibacillus centrosporus]|uniref:Acetolactate synthase-1/2/3 large subunit n=1 Tax=Brevibacillus centrosporus TaxID=54910 RepID=A0A1I3SMP2_9BACL|nr:thiamine pyrophosphate-requiring protein [Brevibacillus centrosporus]SFJ59690.1 acetolactate synthase-1/2/3 large subunit [Brevibacillus centrosporus]